jgi:hypothetical protein
MHSTDAIAGSVLGGIAIATAVTLALLYFLAPFLLYGIYRRLGRLIELQEYLLTQTPQVPQAPQRTAQQRADELTAARAQWGKP